MNLEEEKSAQRLTADELATPATVLSPDEQVFLEGLTELTLRTGISISGCGCCGSPQLETANTSRGGKYTTNKSGPWNVGWEPAK